jgi:pimeloyl-ACP methyl ester carboxylesterase
LHHFRVGAGEPLILIHGIGSRWQMWNPVIERLAAEREVVALDLPGFGASPPPPPGTPAGVRSLTELVGQFLDGLGLEQPHLAGNSLGGWISLELAKQRRGRTATALSPGGFHNDAEALYQRATLWTSRRGARLLAPQVQRLMRSPRMRRAVLGQYMARPERISHGEAAESITALAGAPWFDETLHAITREHFSGGAQIHVPVTVAWGARDRLLLPRQARRVRAAIPTARIISLKGCGHVPTFDDPEQVARVLLEGSGAGA